jgi:hypothetical protein
MLDMLEDPTIRPQLDIDKARRDVTQLRIQFPLRSATSAIPLLIESLSAATTA